MTVLCSLQEHSAVKIQNQSNHLPGVDEWIKGMYIYAIEYYLALKKKEVLLYVTWMNLDQPGTERHAASLLWSLSKLIS